MEDMHVREPTAGRRWVAAAGLVVAIVAIGACSSGDSLTAKAWQWTAWSTVTPATQSDVPDQWRTCEARRSFAGGMRAR